MGKQENLMGKRVQLDAGREILTGTVVDYQQPVLMNGAVLISARYRVKWDDGDESGWLSQYELKEV